MSQTPNFMDFVQEHERTWGTETYPGRPELAEILAANVVVFWQSSDTEAPHYTITLHQELGELDEHLSKMLFRIGIKPPDRRVARIYKAQKPVSVRGIKIIYSDGV